MAAQYQIYTIPEIVVGGKYKTTPSQHGGDREEMFRAIDMLIIKAREEAKQQAKPKAA